MPDRTSPEFWAIAKRQLVVVSSILLLLVLVVGVLYWKDRQREWRLRGEQAAHRLELAYELIIRDLERVRSDILFIASQSIVRNFDAHKAESRRQVGNEFANFLRFKKTYQQIRLIDNNGHETIRLDLQGANVRLVAEDQLQDKKDRYYVRESFKLKAGQLFVSEFDLNQEHGAIERPLNPVIRFVTPVTGDSDLNPTRWRADADQQNEAGDDSKTSLALQGTPENKFLLVANYKGTPLLNDLASISLPGATYLVRSDGQFLLGPDPSDAWGWLLGHDHSLENSFTDAWNNKSSQDICRLTASGAFSFRQLDLAGLGMRDDSTQVRNNLLIVSHLPQEEVFATSRKLLNRLLLLVAAAFLPLLILTRYWAVASLRRELQNALIRKSEQKLRELSTRLVRIQEDERRAISREIHDQLGQQATAINLDLKLSLRATQDIGLQNQLQRIIAESEQLLDRLHDFATRIRPVELDDLGLPDALESHLWEFRERFGIQFNFDTNLENYKLPTVIAENVYRLVQESLNNVLKHASATCVEVIIRVQTGSDPAKNELTMVVRDDGVGVAESTPTGQTGGNNNKLRLGILGMRERVDLLGGIMKIESERGQGTAVEARIPINPVESRQATS